MRDANVILMGAIAMGILLYSIYMKPAAAWTIYIIQGTAQ